jgi:hypothetical protein
VGAGFDSEKFTTIYRKVKGGFDTNKNPEITAIALNFYMKIKYERSARIQAEHCGIGDEFPSPELQRTKRMIALACKIFWHKRGYGNFRIRDVGTRALGHNMTRAMPWKYGGSR